MRIIPFWAGIIFLSSTVYADVQEQNKGEKEEKTPSIIVNNGANLQTESKYPNPF